MRVPEKIGRIEEVFQGKGEEAVLLIQDAHAIPDAQRNIQKLIEFFQTEYGVEKIAVEGASSELDPQIFRSFPDKKILKEVFEGYFAKGELTGTTAAAIFSAINRGGSASRRRRASPLAGGGNETIFQGIEDWALYEEGLGGYLRAIEKEQEIGEKLAKEKEALERKKQEIYSKDLLEVDRAAAGWRKGENDLPGLLSLLGRIREPEPESEIAVLLRELEKQGQSEPELEREIKKWAGHVMDWLQGRDGMDSSDLKAFNDQFQSFQISEINAGEFALFLEELDKRYGIGHELTERVAGVIRDAKRIRALEGVKFFKELESYIRSVKESLFRNDEERRLDEESHRLDLLEKLSRLELSREEWNEIRANAEFGVWSLELEEHIEFFIKTRRRERKPFLRISQD